MAKKNPADLSVEEKLKALYQLQTTLSTIDEKKALRGELPLEVQDLEDELEGLATRVSKIKAEIKEFNDAIKQRKADIEVADAGVKKYKTQLDNVKNNREYDTLNKEIEFQTLEIELGNKKIKEGQLKVEEKTVEMKSSEALMSERTEDLKLKKAELDEIMQETKDEEDNLKDKAKDLETKIEPRLLSSFKRIRKNARNGLGLVYVQRDACGGCFASIPPQRQLDIKMHKKIIVCEYCGRILVDPELVGIKTTPVEVEEKPKRKRATTKSKTDSTETDAEEKPKAKRASRKAKVGEAE